MAQNVFIPLELPILKQHISSCQILFRLNILKGTPKDPQSARCGHEHLKRGTKTTFLLLKDLGRAPFSFLWESPRGSLSPLFDHYLHETVRLFVIIGLVRVGPSPRLREFCCPTRIRVCAIHEDVPVNRVNSIVISLSLLVQWSWLTQNWAICITCFRGSWQSQTIRI